MNYSYQQYIGDGSTGPFSFSFRYIDPSYVRAYVDGVLVPFTFLNSSSIRLNTAAPIGSLVEVKRDTDKGSRLVDFQDGSVLTEKDLDVSAEQLFHISQEAYDRASTSQVGSPTALSEALAAAQGSTLIGFEQFAGGTKRTIADVLRERVSVRSFGAKGDGVTDDTFAIQSAINYANTNPQVTDIYIPQGVYIQNATLVIKSGVRLIGAGRKQTVIKKAAGFNGDAVRTENYDVLVGTAEALSNPLTPKEFAIKGMTFDGSYMLDDWKADNNSYINTSGGGLRLVGRYYELDIEVFNMAGVGVYTECKGSETRFEYRRDIDWSLDVYVCKEECVIFKGPSDGRMSHLWAAAGGARTKAEWDTTPPSSPTYGSVNGGVTDNIVLDGAGAEIEKIHSFGALSGAGFRTIGGPRLNIDLIIVESSRYGGVNLSGTTYGMIDRLDVHGCNGGLDGSIPDILIASTGILTINAIGIMANSSVDSGQNRVHVTGSFVSVGHATIKCFGKPGHGIVNEGNYNTINGFIVDSAKGTAKDGRASAGLLRIATAATRGFRARGLAVSCDRAFFSVGIPTAEAIEVGYSLATGQQAFDGDPRTYNGNQRWELSGTVNSVPSSSEASGSAVFDPTLTTEQTLTIPHALVYVPNPANVFLTIQDTPTNFALGAVQYFLVSGIDASNITVKVKMSVANGSNTAPRINARAFI